MDMESKEKIKQKNSCEEVWDFVHTREYLANMNDKLQKLDVLDHYSRERAKTKWKVFGFTKVTKPASLFKDVRLGCKDTVFSATFLKNPYFWERYGKNLQWQPRFV